MTHPDTKAAWKRRALRAEAQLQTLQQIRKTDHDVNRNIYARSAWQATCLTAHISRRP